MTMQPAAERTERAAPESTTETDVTSWMVLQLAVHIRRARTRRELFRVSERDLDRMGLTRFDIRN